SAPGGAGVDERTAPCLLPRGAGRRDQRRGTGGPPPLAVRGGPGGGPRRGGAGARRGRRLLPPPGPRARGAPPDVAGADRGGGAPVPHGHPAGVRGSRARAGPRGRGAVPGPGDADAPRRRPLGRRVAVRRRGAGGRAVRQPAGRWRRNDGMRVVLAGGTGLIGTALTVALTRAGHEVVVLTRRPPGEVRGLPPGAEAARWTAGEPVG